MQIPLSKRAFSESLGTFAIVFFGCGSIMVVERFPHTLNPVAIPIVFGLIVAAMIYGLGHVSGAHFNPAVTLAFAVSRHFPFREVLIYWVAQCSGAILASLALSALLPAGIGNGETTPHLPLLQTFGWEALLTFFLMFVVMGVATDTRAVGTMAGVAIGAVIILEAYVAGPLTGASMNPARSLGPAIISGNLGLLWLYISSQFLGATVGSLCYQWLRSDARTPSKS